MLSAVKLPSRVLVFLLLAGKSDEQFDGFYFRGSSRSKQQPAALHLSESHSIMDASPVLPHSCFSACSSPGPLKDEPA